MLFEYTYMKDYLLYYQGTNVLKIRILSISVIFFSMSCGFFTPLSFQNFNINSSCNFDSSNYYFEPSDKSQNVEDENTEDKSKKLPFIVSINDNSIGGANSGKNTKIQKFSSCFLKKSQPIADNELFIKKRYVVCEEMGVKWSDICEHFEIKKEIKSRLTQDAQKVLDFVEQTEGEKTEKKLSNFKNCICEKFNIDLKQLSILAKSSLKLKAYLNSFSGETYSQSKKITKLSKAKNYLEKCKGFYGSSSVEGQLKELLASWLECNYTEGLFVKQREIFCKENNVLWKKKKAFLPYQKVSSVLFDMDKKKILSFVKKKRGTFEDLESVKRDICKHFGVTKKNIYFIIKDIDFFNDDTYKDIN